MTAILLTLALLAPPAPDVCWEPVEATQRCDHAFDDDSDCGYPSTGMCEYGRCVCL